MKPTLMSWSGHDELLPYPWATVACPACGERELATAHLRKPTEFVCMACGCVAEVWRLKAITVQQPWAWCIATGNKPEENRGWITRYRGPLAIHAGLTVDTDSIDMVRRLLEELGAVEPECQVGDRHLLAQGAIVAVADLWDICTVHSIPCGCSVWAGAGQNHWRLRDVRPFAEPVPMRGRQGLWDVDLAMAVAA